MADDGWQETCTQILLGLNSHTARLDELEQHLSAVQAEVRVAQAERAEARVEAAAARAEAQEHARHAAASESRLQALEQACQSRLRRGSGQQRQHGQQESRRFRHDVTTNGTVSKRDLCCVEMILKFVILQIKISIVF